MPDIINMLPSGYWILTAVILSLLILQILLARSSFEIKLEKLFLTIIVPLMLYASLPISQFPSIFTVNDAVEHLADAENVMVNAGIHTPASGYLQFPGASFLVAMVGKFTGITTGVPLILLGIVLNAVFVVLISLFLLFIGLRILGSRNGFILPVLFFVVNTDFFTQFCSQNFALVFYFIAIFVFLILGTKSIQSGQSILVTIILVFISAVTTITHPITSIFLIATFFGIYIGQKIFKNKIGVNISIQFLLCIIGILIAWWFFFATENFEALINSVVSFFRIGIQYAPTHVVIQTFSTFPAEVLSFSTKGIQAFMAGAATVGFILIWLKRKTKPTQIMLLEFLIGILLVSVFPIFLLNGEFADRPLQFVYFPMCALAILGLENVTAIASKKIRFTKHWRTLGICLLIIILPFTLIYHHQTDSIQNVINTDFSATGFLIKYSPSVPVALPWTTGLRAEYYFQDPLVANIKIPHPPSSYLDPWIFISWLSLKPPVLVFSLKESRAFEYIGTTSTDYTNRVSYLNESSGWDRAYDSDFNTIYVSSSLTNATSVSGLSGVNFAP